MLFPRQGLLGIKPKQAQQTQQTQVVRNSRQEMHKQQGWLFRMYRQETKGFSAGQNRGECQETNTYTTIHERSEETLVLDVFPTFLDAPGCKVFQILVRSPPSSPTEPAANIRRPLLD